MLCISCGDRAATYGPSCRRCVVDPVPTADPVDLDESTDTDPVPTGDDESTDTDSQE